MSRGTGVEAVERSEPIGETERWLLIRPSRSIGWLTVGVPLVFAGVVAVAAALWRWWVLGVFAAFVAFSAWRNTRVRVSADATGLIVRNPVRRYRVPWSDVLGFELRRGSGSWGATRWPGSWVVCLRVGRRPLAIEATHCLRGAGETDFYGRPVPSPPSQEHLEKLEAARRRWSR